MPDNKEMILKTEYTVVMANEIMKSRSNLSINALKLLRTTISNIFKDDTALSTYTVPLVELADFIGVSRQDIHKEVYEITRELMTEVIEIRTGAKKQNWKMLHWCDTCEYEDGIITIKISEQIKQYLIGLKSYYTQYYLYDTIQFKSKHTFRIYELIIEEMKTKSYSSNIDEKIYLPIEMIRTATNTENTYPKLSLYKKYVIDRAINEINARSFYYDITYTERTEGRKNKLIGIDIHIKSKDWSEKPW